MKKILFIASVIVLGLTSSCEQQQKPSTETTEVNSNERELMVSGSINQYPEGIAIQLWDKDNWGETLAQQLKWQEQCRQKLICCFDSIHPENHLSETEKVDSLLSELEQHFNGDWADTTYEMVENGRHRKGFMMYQIIDHEKQILDIDSSWKPEIEAWNRFQKTYQSFAMGLVEVGYWGGTIRGPLYASVVLTQLEGRLKDLKRILSCLRGKDKSGKAGNLDLAISKFTNAAESKFQNYKETGEGILKEDGIEQSEWDKISQEQQQDLTDMNQELSKWSEIRKTLPVLTSAVKMIEKLAMDMQSINDY